MPIISIVTSSTAKKYWNRVRMRKEPTFVEPWHEIEIKQCGSSSALLVTSYLILLSMVTAIWIT
ncbi:voltage-dependent calcium channel subunit alpha-2/delta-3 isoform X3 [Aphis craccivora]|uniref:Voltage-dependent calcium channel subunit alpha-2/delta-3 isoform X3 n=1 Tax=Aphis craccivora TaxID=307492 RepID=A0A6G0Z3K9_APHCR|nr:voltage-dependent calcium channel subunit alpha-2/delta-3 isoform X3 [Aphis craccivora]